MASDKDRFGNLIKEISAEFLVKESNGTSLITVTSVLLSRDAKRATVLVTVMPEDKEEEAFNFLKRQQGSLREYLKEKIKNRNIPFVEIQKDLGEKNRQKIDQLLRDA